MVQSTAYSSQFPASSVLILGEEQAVLANGKYNFWMARERETTGQGFTVKVDSCPRMIAGFHIKNTGGGGYGARYTTREFKISGAKYENGPWQKMVQEELVDTRGKVASLLNFTFEDPVEIKYLRFDLISYWENADGGAQCGALQYFAPIPVTSGYRQNMSKDYN